MREMVGGCCVCSDERGWPENPLVYCDGQNCTVAVHQACYGIVTVPTGPWFCRKCESQERPARVRCELCPSRDGALKRTDNAGWAHVVCALYIPEVRFGNVTTMEPIILQLIPPERYAKTCYICQDIGKVSRATVGACMQCNKSGCKQQFHVTCAQALGLLCEEAGNYLDNVKYCGYCQYHYGKLKKGGNVKTIPPYKPVTHDTDTSSTSSPEKEVESNITASASSTSATSIKITTNTSANAISSNVTSSNSSQSSKQRKSSSTSRPSSSVSGQSSNLSGNINNPGGGGSSMSQSSSSTSSSNKTSTSKDKDKHSSKSLNKVSSSSRSQDKEKESSTSSSSSSRDKSSSKSSKSSSSSSNKETSSNTSNIVGGGNSSSNVHASTSDHASSNLPPPSVNLHSGGSTTSSQPQNLSNSGQNKDSSIQKFKTPSNSNVDIIANAESTIGGGSTVSNPGVTSENINTTSSSSSSKSSSSSASKKRKADALKSSNETPDVNSSSFRDIIKDVSVTLIPLPIEKSEGSNESEKGSSKKPKTESGSQSSHDSHQTSTTGNSINTSSAPFSSSSSSHVKSSSTVVIKDENRSRSGGSQYSSNSNSSVNAGLLSSTSQSTVHNTSSNSNNNASNNNNPNSSGSTPSLYVSVPLSTANVPGINLPSSASNGLTSGTGSGINQSNSLNNSSTSGKQSPRVLTGFPSSTTQSTSNLTSSFPTESSKNVTGGGSGSSSAAIQNNNSSVIQPPNASPLNSSSNLNVSNESVNLTIKYEKQNFRVSKLQEQESGPARRSRTPDSGNYSNTSLSQTSLSTSTSSLNNGGLKFSYEPQVGVGSSSSSHTISALSPPLIDTNIGAVIKESPQSSPNSESGSVISRKRGRKSAENKVVPSSNGPIPMVVESKHEVLKQENKVLQNGNGTTITTSSTTTLNLSSTNTFSTAHHMLGNHINPNSNMAKNMNDLVHMEIQENNVYNTENGPHMVGVPFPGKRHQPLSQNPPNSTSTNPLTSMLTGTATSTPSGNTPQSLEQLLERQWEQGSQFLMEQAQHFDIASLLSCLHQLRTENMRLEDHVNSLIARRDHLLAVNARLAIPLTSSSSQSQVSTKKRRS